MTDNLISENALHGIDFATGSRLFAFPPDPATRGGVAAGNTITGNGGSGVRVDGADRLTITGNAIAGDARLGIDLSDGKGDAFGGPGTTPTTATSAPTSASLPRAADGNRRREGHGRRRADRLPGAAIAHDRVLRQRRADPSGHGEGETFVGTARPQANGRFTATLPAGLAGRWLTAAATDSAGDTSEFSEAVQVDVR